MESGSALTSAVGTNHIKRHSGSRKGKNVRLLTSIDHDCVVVVLERGILRV